MCAKRKKDEEKIYYDAVAMPPAERMAFIKGACGNDTDLLARVEALLKAREVDDDFLIDPVPDSEITLDTSPLSEEPGTVIGRYKLLEQIGEGGMAVVYMAEQERPLRRRVALKIIKLGMDTKQVIARFEAERQALAVMDHPNIAKVFDAGTTKTGRPYFVMELVRGVSISEYCDKNRLDTKERLDLFVQVCNAVHHAHQKGIIHRDIKPSNVMVTLHDGKPVPKVIDFGIAKATSQRLTEKTLYTRYAQMIGTPAYMSPEQAEMSGLDIDTRTDIYSLGVLLYELLTGVTPFSEEQLREAGYLEMQRIICEEEPTRPSTKLSTMGEESTVIAEHRKASPDLLQKQVRGDLDWIVMKSLEKDRARRYDTAAELLADITRHLNDEPVSAGPPSKIYRLRKFLRRHRTQAIGAMMVSVLLAGMAVVSVMYLKALNRGEEAESLKHKDILSKAMELRSSGQFQEALAKVETIADSKHVGPKALLLRARLVLELQGPAAAVKELEKLLKERDDIACQAHFLLARIYLESAPGDPETTEEYQQKAKEHQQKGEKLFSESAEAYFNRSMMAGTVNKSLEWLNKALDFDPGHYDSLEARAMAYYVLHRYDEMEIDASVMIGNESNNSQGYALRAIARRQKAIKEGKKELLSAALRDHDKAIGLSPDDPELYNQRRSTHMQMGNYEKALSDARECVRLKPDEKMYHFHSFCALVALGYYDEAKVKYDTIIQSGLMTRRNLDMSAAKYVSDMLDAGLSWHPTERGPEGAAFLAMCESAEVYEQLAKRGRRVVAEGFTAHWSPDGSQLIYSRGVFGFAGIEIVNLESGKTRLLTVPGYDPAWSPDGEHIAFVRSRQALLLNDLTAERTANNPALAEPEVWIIKADGTEEPHFLARGGEPRWSRDSKRVFYQRQKGTKLSSISIEDGAKPTPIIQCLSYFPAVSPDEKYVAYGQRDGERRIVELTTNSIVASWIVPMATGDGFLNWSPDGQELSIGDYGIANSGLWIYDVKAGKASKVLSGLFGRSVWSPPEISQIAIERKYGGLHNEIWVANLDPNMSAAEALGPGRTAKEHCQEMADFYTRRIETEPENSAHYISRAECYVYLQDNKKAFADLEKHAEINPSGAAWGYGNLAWRLVKRPQEMFSPEVAVELFRKANEIKPEVWHHLSGLGIAFYRAGRWEEAIAALTKSTELLNGEDSLNFLFLSMAHWQSGNKAAAINRYNKAIERIQKSNIDIARMSNLYNYYIEAAELLGVKIKEFYRKAPLTGKLIQTVTARADSSRLDMAIEHIVDGTSLRDVDGDGLLEHGETPENMWLSEKDGMRNQVEFDLGRVYELGSILVWNYNERGHTKRGVKKADISVWTAEGGWQKIFDDLDFTEAEGSFDYDEPTLMRFDGLKAQRVLFDDLIGLGDEEYVGLSEVRFFQRRGPEAIRPYPADGAEIGIPMEAKLSWTAGVGVKAHKVYFGTNPDSLKYIGRFEAGNRSEVKLTSLEKRQRYWWRADAEKSDGSMIKGNLWSFSTGRMVGWWKFSEAKDDTVIDSSGSGLNGRLVGGAHIISDPERGSVLSLDGEGDYVDCGNNPAFDITNSITVAAWVNIDTIPQEWTSIVTKGDSAWRLSTFEDQRKFHFAVTHWTAGTNWVNGDTEVAGGQWHHVCGTYDGANIRLYVDGVEDPESPVAYSGNIGTNGWEVLIGANTDWLGCGWNGLIDDVRIYSYALSKAEVKEVIAGRGPGPNERPE